MARRRIGEPLRSAYEGIRSEIHPDTLIARPLDQYRIFCHREASS